MNKHNIVKIIDDYVKEIKNNPTGGTPDRKITNQDMYDRIEDLKQEFINTQESKFSKGVSLLCHYKGDSITYKCNCSCNDDDHNVVIDFEIDKHGIIFLNFYKDVAFFNHYYRKTLWFDDFKKQWSESTWNFEDTYDIIEDFLDNTIFHYWRSGTYLLKSSLKLLFTGYLEMHEDFVLQDEQLDNFIGALIEGREIIKNESQRKLRDRK